MSYEKNRFANRNFGIMPEIYDSCCARKDSRCADNEQKQNQIVSKLRNYRQQLDDIPWKSIPLGLQRAGDEAYSELEKVENLLRDRLADGKHNIPEGAKQNHYSFCIFSYCGKNACMLRSMQPSMEKIEPIINSAVKAAEVHKIANIPPEQKAAIVETFGPVQSASSSILGPDVASSQSDMTLILIGGGLAGLLVISGLAYMLLK